MLDQYATYVLSAYAVSIVLVIGIVVISVIRSNKVKADLDALEHSNG